MNKKVLWISLASVATLGVAGFFVWRAVKKKKANKALEENTQDADYVEVQGTEDTQDAPQGQAEEPQQQTPPHIDIEENVVYLSAKWCPACKQNQEVAEKLYAKYNDKVEFIMLDADDEDAKSYGYQLQIRHIPTLAFVNDGEKIDELVGPQTMEQYEEKMAKYFPQLFKKKAKMVAKPAPAPPAPPAPATPPPAPLPKAEAVEAPQSETKALAESTEQNHSANGKEEVKQESEKSNA
jgi:thiol-disulfide isomerase/thioredoxin